MSFLVSPEMNNLMTLIGMLIFWINGAYFFGRALATKDQKQFQIFLLLFAIFTLMGDLCYVKGKLRDISDQIERLAAEETP